MSNTDLELLQFRYSHFNEKARWGLDHKGLAHRRTSVLPGPHARRIQRLTGQSQVPVVRFSDSCVSGSARILDELERRQPEPPLYPSDPAERSRALEIQAHFDEVVGPLVRRALFSVLLHEPGYICRMFAGHRRLPVRLGYRATLPLAATMIKKGMGISDEASIREAFEGTREALDFVAKTAGPGGFLVGDRFSVADLTAAALLAPTTCPEGSKMDLPRPRPAHVTEWLERWAIHPGSEWVRQTYRRHRPTSAEVT